MDNNNYASRYQFTLEHSSVTTLVRGVTQEYSVLRYPCNDLRCYVRYYATHPLRYVSGNFFMTATVHVQHHTVLHVNGVQTAATLHTIRCTQLSPYPVCWDLLPSPAVAAQSYGGLPHWHSGEMCAGTVIDIRIGDHHSVSSRHFGKGGQNGACNK